MEIRYFKLKPEDIEKAKGKAFEEFDTLYEQLIDKIVEAFYKDLDDAYYKFLTTNGYNIDKPYDMNQLEEIMRQLEKEDKFLDKLDYTIYAKDCSKVTNYIIPFFNSISNPLSEEDKQELLEKWKKENRKDEIV